MALNNSSAQSSCPAAMHSGKLARMHSRWTGALRGRIIQGHLDLALNNSKNLKNFKKSVDKNWVVRYNLHCSERDTGTKRKRCAFSSAG